MCVEGDGDGTTSVSDYVEQLRADLIQQAVDERSSWLQSQFKPLCTEARMGSQQLWTLLGS